jgi:hypothetical protein
MGIGEADALCAAEAAAAQLPGGYKALIATSRASAISRFDTQRAPWVRTDGVLLAPTAAEFAAGNLLASIGVAADGTHAINWRVWTGSAAVGQVGTNTCDDWNPADAGATSGELGTASASNHRWFGGQQDTCDALGDRLYCLEE